MSNDRNTCGVCNEKVFHAEEVQCEGHYYHQNCFICMKCRKSLDSTTITTHELGIHCKSCYLRKYGPKGYGYEGGAGAMTRAFAMHFGTIQPQLAEHVGEVSAQSVKQFWRRRFAKI
uniref:LIM zinc-binding domain-containing protein n=1 Tax=Eptatretus burgeri TaxID=7764 RepID=A0A8C4X0T6_EPTBU